MPKDQVLESNDLFQKIKTFLQDKKAYPHPVASIQVIETHISVVFLTGKFAYKLKKPVNFGFLDFSDALQRKTFCEKELFLNQRTAPDLYLEVSKLYSNNGQLSFSPASSDQQPIEHLVKMQQFNPNLVLGKRLAGYEKLTENQPGLTSTQVEVLTQQIARLHQQAEIVKADTQWGEPLTILKPMLDNFPSLRRFFAHSAEVMAVLQKLEARTYQNFEQLKTTLKQRKQNRFIRSCHGDLHLDNIALINQKPVLFDAIEFNDAFSKIDTISDLAFLLIDLEYRGEHTLAKTILTNYLHYTQDYSALRLLNFYKTYRAMVRAKITALQAEQVDKNSQQYREFVDKTKRYIDLAKTDQTAAKAPAKLILLQGVSGSGKSHFAQQLLQRIDGIVISSDRTRKQLFGINPQDRVTPQQKTALYSSSMNQKTYRTLESNASIALQSGITVIVDATFIKKAHRSRFYQLCQSLALDCYVISIKISSKVAAASIAKRHTFNQDPSDADEKVLKRQLEHVEMPDTSENALILEAEQIRRAFPEQFVQEFLNLPL